MSTRNEKKHQGCPQRARLDEAEAAVRRFTSPYQKWPLYDAKAALRTAREEYISAVLTKLGKRPEPAGDYPTVCKLEERAQKARAELARIRKAKGSWADETDAACACAVAENDFETANAQYEVRYVKPRAAVRKSTTEARKRDTELPPLVKIRKSPDGKNE